METDSEKASALSSQYKTVFTVDNGIMPPCQQYMPLDSLTDIEITERDIVRAIKNMNADSSPGFDKIYPKLVKNIAPYIIKPLHKIFTRSMHESTIPEDWLTSIIIPIFKKNGKPSLCSSYRPINLTSCVSKILERVIYQKMLAYLKSNNLISKAQHGFLAKKSTITNLLTCTYEWAKLLNNKQPFDIVYIDYEKAFDKVPHPKLFYKLTKLGFGGQILAWLKMFITRRKQCVRVRNSYSNYEGVDSGVAQGTLLGPLMFLLYLSDVTSAINEESCSIILYADDSKIYGNCKMEEDCHELNQNLLSLQDWCAKWQLSINSDKCEILRVGRGNINFEYEINGNIIPSSDNCKDLGVHVGKDLYYRDHYNIVARNNHHLCKQFRTAFASKNIEFLLFLYKTYIMPKIEYASSIWSPYLKKDVDLIENIQRKFTKFLPGMFNKPYYERMLSLQMQTLEERRIYLDLILLYKIYHGLVDMEFSKFCSLSTSNTRGHPLKLNVVGSRVNCHKYHFFNRTIKVWNDVPANIITIDSLNLFKKRIFEYDVKKFCIGRALT